MSHNNRCNDSIHMYDPGYEIGRYTTDQLYATAGQPFEDANRSGQRWYGLHIDARSSYRAVLCYFDNDRDPIPLVAGRPLRRPFQRVKITPIADWTHMPTLLTLPASSTSPAPPTFAGELLLGWWREKPDPQDPPLVDPGVVEIRRLLVIGATASQAALPILAAHLPGAERLTFWCHNNGQTNTNAVDVTAFELCPERTDATSSSWITTPRLGRPIGPRLRIPSGASLSVQRFCLLEPSAAEYCLLVDFTGAGSGTFTVAAGIFATFPRGDQSS